MAEEVRVSMPVTDEDGHLGFEDAVKTVLDDDGALWCTFKCKGIREIVMRKGGTTRVQEFTFGFAGKDDNGDFLKRADGSSDWYEIKITLWGSDATHDVVDGNYVDKEGNVLEWKDWAAGDRLATLFGIGDPKKGMRCRIIFNPRKCYGNPGKDGRVWYKYSEPEEPDDLYLCRPVKSACSSEQNELWDEIERECRKEHDLKVGWIKLFTAKADNPFPKCEEEIIPQQQDAPVAAGASDYDDYEL